MFSCFMRYSPCVGHHGNWIYTLPKCKVLFTCLLYSEYLFIPLHPTPTPSHSDVLALPIFKQEDGNTSVESEIKNPPFQYVLCAATSPAVKLQEETLTYLNQGT